MDSLRVVSWSQTERAQPVEAASVVTRSTTMSTHPISHRQVHMRQWWLGLGLVIVIAAVGTYRYIAAPAVSVLPASTTTTAALDPAQQGVSDYLRVHATGRAPALVVDPAQQGVSN